MIRVLGLAALVGIVGCAPQQQLMRETASGYAEEVMPATTVEVVKAKIMESCTNRGALVQEATGNQVLCGMTMSGGDGMMAQLLLGNSYSTTPERKARFTIIQTGPNVRVSAQQWIETQMAFGQIKRAELNSPNHRNDMQRLLAEIAATSQPLRVLTEQRAAEAQANMAPSSTSTIPGVSVSKPPPATGQDAYVAGKFGRDAKCGSIETPAVLAAKGPGYETYSMACTSGDTMMIRCELGNCRALR